MGSGGLAETPPLNFCFPLYPKGLPFLMIESQMHFTYCHAGGIDPSDILKWETLRFPPAQLMGNHWLCGKGEFLEQEGTTYMAAPSLSL